MGSFQQPTPYALVEMNPSMDKEHTNGETLIWVQSLKGYGKETLKSAKLFLDFEGDYRKLKSWKEIFLIEHKQIKQQIHSKIMKESGGTGAKIYFSTPPRDYVPDTLKSGNKCVMCDVIFESEDSLDCHIRSIHKDVVKKSFSREAFEMVMKAEDYTEWLKKPVAKIVVAKKTVTVSQMQETNRILVDKLNSQNENNYEVVKKCDGIIEMKKRKFTQKEDGTTKVSMISEQFVNVTSRKRQLEDDDGHDRQRIDIRHKSEKLRNVVKHVAGESTEKQAGLVAKLIDAEGGEFAKVVSEKSKQIKDQNKFTPEHTAALAAATNCSVSQMDRFRTAHRNVTGTSPYASRHQVEKLQKEFLTISREDWDAKEHDLYLHKTGNSVNEKKKTCVFSVKDLRTYVQKMAEAEKENLKNLEDMAELKVCYDGDGGGDRFTFEFAFINNTDREIKIHPILLFEGVDTRPNLEVTLGIDLSDGQFLIAMRCRCFLCNSDAMSMVFGHSYHRNRYDYFCSTIGTDYFPMFFPI